MQPDLFHLLDMSTGKNAHLEDAVVLAEIICYAFYIYSPINFSSKKLSLNQQFYLFHIDK